MGLVRIFELPMAGSVVIVVPRMVPSVSMLVPGTPTTEEGNSEIYKGNITKPVSVDRQFSLGVTDIHCGTCSGK